MGKSSPPAPPDPRETSAAATSTNVGTAISNAYLGNVNQNTPDGSLNYSQTGSYTWRDPYTGKSYDIPTFTADTTLSPEGQKIHDTNLGTQQNIANIGRDQSARIGDLLGTPLDLSSTAIEDHLFDLAQGRLQPTLDRRRASQEASLVDRGIRPGSDAYDRAQTVQNQSENDLYNQLYLNGRGQAVQEILTGRNQPINEITALLSGSQVSQPNFVNTSMPTIPTTDVAGNINTNYAQQMQGYQSQVQQQQALMGGLFGLASKFIPSDRRLKEDIHRVGQTDNGLPLYAYRYRGTDEMRIGLMAQDVERTNPDAVVTMPNGFKAVDYPRALGRLLAE